jgi:hypothetical protein
MSTNVDHVECLSGELTISEEGRSWLEKAENGEIEWFPECGPGVTVDGTVDMCWSGCRSGTSTIDTLPRFFSFTRGTAEFVLHWDGMGCEGIRVVDGVMTKHEVEMKLGKEVK